MHERFGDEVMAHLEFVRFDGQIACLGLPIVRFSTEERLDEIIRHHEDYGCPIFNPHAFTLEEGGMKQVDRTHLAFKRKADPEGLLNPARCSAGMIRITPPRAASRTCTDLSRRAADPGGAGRGSSTRTRSRK